MGAQTVLRTRFVAATSGWRSLLYRLFLRRWAAADLRRFKRFVESRPQRGETELVHATTSAGPDPEDQVAGGSPRKSASVPPSASTSNVPYRIAPAIS